MPKISIIVAVYAAEKYLEHCLDSILSQTFTDFEVVLVDDGSKDASGKICDDYEKKDSRIRVVHKENGGVASARQCGLDCAIGEYIIHVDPDDWIEPNMLQELYQKAVEDSSDLVFCDFIRHENDRTEYVSQKCDMVDSQSIMRGLFQDLHGACWNKLIRRSLFAKYGIVFPLNLIVWEDLYVCVNLTMHNIRISYLSKAFYHYDCSINENSLVNAASIQKLNSMIFFIRYFETIANFDKDLLNRRKIDAKRVAFLMCKMTRKKFQLLFPEVDNFFVKKFNGFKKIDTLIRFSIVHSWALARVILFAWLIRQRIIRFL